MFNKLKKLFVSLFERIFTISSKAAELTKIVNDLEVRIFKLEDIVMKQTYVLTAYTKIQEGIVDHILGTVTKGHTKDNISSQSSGMIIFSEDDDDLIN